MFVVNDTITCAQKNFVVVRYDDIFVVNGCRNRAMGYESDAINRSIY